MALRYMCLDNGIPLEEQVVVFEDWPKVKPTTPFGQLPILYDEKNPSFVVAQSNAMLRHVARTHGLYGNDTYEATTIDSINDEQEDIRLTYLRLIYQEYDKEKDNYIKKLPEKLEILEKTLKKNSGGSGFFVGSKASFADYTVFDLLDNLSVLSPGCLDAFPALKGFHGRMAAREKLAKYRQTDGFKTMPINGNGKQ